MADPGFPGQHTTTTVHTTNTTVQTNIRFDNSYLRTLPGLLKGVQIIANIIGFICIETSGYATHTRGQWFNTVATIGFLFTSILLAMYLFHIIEKFYKIPWLKVEFVFCTLWTLLYLIACCLVITYGNEAFIAAGFFGFCAMVAYGIDAFVKFTAIKSGRLAQGERVISKQTTTLSTPQY